ncbi:MAG: hypothetical protein ACYC1M_00015 [Armatimonadota bacterium]
MNMQKTCNLLLALSALLIPAVHSDAVIIPTTLSRGYSVEYDTSSKALRCISANGSNSWTATVASPVPSVGDWSGIGTAAGPVFVYTISNSVHYTLLRHNTGKAITDVGNKSLTGVLAPGKFISATWREAGYGAEVSVVSLDGNKEYTTTFDINMWGTSTKKGQTSRSLPIQRVAIPGTSISFEIPPGFTNAWDANSRSMGIRSQTKLPVGILINVAENDDNITLFADLFMKDIGPAMGAQNMQQIASQPVSIGGSMQGLLRMTSCVWNGRNANFSFVFIKTKSDLLVVVYGTPTENYDTYANLFYRMLSSMQVK